MPTSAILYHCACLACTLVMTCNHIQRRFRARLASRQRRLSPRILHCSSPPPRGINRHHANHCDRPNGIFKHNEFLQTPSKQMFVSLLHSTLMILLDSHGVLKKCAYCHHNWGYSLLHKKKHLTRVVTVSIYYNNIINDVWGMNRSVDFNNR